MHGSGAGLYKIFYTPGVYWKASSSQTVDRSAQQKPYQHLLKYMINHDTVAQSDGG